MLFGLWAVVIGFGLANESEDYAFLPIVIAIFAVPPMIAAIALPKRAPLLLKFGALGLLLVWPFVIWHLTWFS